MVGEGNYIGGIIMSHNFQYISKHDEKVVSAYECYTPEYAYQYRNGGICRK